MRHFICALLSLAWLAGCAPSPDVEVVPVVNAGAEAEDSAAVAEDTATLDRTVPPPPGPTPTVDFPAVQRHTLSNGLEIWVVERRELPLVSMQLMVQAGSAAENADDAGLASLVAEMLDEGTNDRSALEIADELDYLGADLFTGAGYDASYLVLNSLRRTFDSALEVFSDIATSPAFPEQELVRVRNEQLTSIVESFSQPTTVASRQFATRIYGPGHPYGRPVGGTANTVSGIDAAALQRYYDRYYHPNNAHLIVVGDVSADSILPVLEEEFGGWESAEVPEVDFPPPPPPQEATRIYLIDKPGAAQSEIRIGHLGVPRTSEDYFPLLVMNTILGGQFTSRINLNLREDKGYTYGARSEFDMRQQAGPFVAAAGVQTPSTKESVIEFMKELEGIRGSIPVTEEELEFAKAAIIRSEPRRQETNQQVAGRVEELILYGLPLDYYDNYTERVQAVTLEDVRRVASEYLDPEHFAIVIVGDRATVEAALRELPYEVEVVELETPTIPTASAG